MLLICLDCDRYFKYLLCWISWLSIRITLICDLTTATADNKPLETILSSVFYSSIKIPMAKMSTGHPGPDISCFMLLVGVSNAVQVFGMSEGNNSNSWTEPDKTSNNNALRHKQGSRPQMM